MQHRAGGAARDARHARRATSPTCPPSSSSRAPRPACRCSPTTPRRSGADRIVNTLAAHHLFGGPCIVVDFGTSTNLDVVSAKGEFLGGALAPGHRDLARRPGRARGAAAQGRAGPAALGRSARTPSRRCSPARSTASPARSTASSTGSRPSWARSRPSWPPAASPRSSCRSRADHAPRARPHAASACAWSSRRTPTPSEPRRRVGRTVGVEPVTRAVTACQPCTRPAVRGRIRVRMPRRGAAAVVVGVVADHQDARGRQAEGRRARPRRCGGRA